MKNNTNTPTLRPVQFPISDRIRVRNMSSNLDYYLVPKGEGYFISSAADCMGGQMMYWSDEEIASKFQEVCHYE